MDYIKPAYVVKNMLAAGKTKASPSMKNLFIGLFFYRTYRPAPARVTSAATPGVKGEPANA